MAVLQASRADRGTLKTSLKRAARVIVAILRASFWCISRNIDGPLEGRIYVRE